MAKKRKSKDQILIGWNEISEHVPFAATTLKNKYGKEMQEKGFGFKSAIGNASSPMVWSYPDFIRGFVIMKSKENGGKKF